MAKPIAIIYFPDGFISERLNHSWIYDYMSFLNGEDRDDAKVKWGNNKGYFSQHYWFCFYKMDIAEPEFKVFHEKDFTEIQYEELKQLITESLKQK